MLAPARESISAPPSITLHRKVLTSAVVTCLLSARYMYLPKTISRSTFLMLNMIALVSLAPRNDTSSAPTNNRKMVPFPHSV